MHVPQGRQSAPPFKNLHCRFRWGHRQYFNVNIANILAESLTVRRVARTLRFCKGACGEFSRTMGPLFAPPVQFTRRS